MTTKRKVRRPTMPEKIEGQFSILQAKLMEGKTVASVSVGFAPENTRNHVSELLLIQFTDGTALSIETGSNAQNVADSFPGMKPSEFHVDFMLDWGE